MCVKQEKMSRARIKWRCVSDNMEENDYTAKLTTTTFSNSPANTEYALSVLTAVTILY